MNASGAHDRQNTVLQPAFMNITMLTDRVWPMLYSIGRRITTLTLQAVNYEDQGSRLLLMRGTANLDLVLMIS